MINFGISQAAPVLVAHHTIKAGYNPFSSTYSGNNPFNIYPVNIATLDLMCRHVSLPSMTTP